MNRSPEVREFLTSRRARIAPEQAGLQAIGNRRRVPGLRREEVAKLTGVSVDYYSNLERGSLRGVSDSVLEALARALQLTEAERAHLFDLARHAQPGRAAGAAKPSGCVPLSIQWLLEAMDGVPAYVRNGRFDILSINQLGRAVFSELVDTPHGEVNLARFMFLDPRARDFFVDWDEVARDTVHTLRSEAGRSPRDQQLTDLVGMLGSGSPEFVSWWAEHDVTFHVASRKKLHHPIVGDLDLSGEGLDLPSAPGLRLVTYIAEPGSESHRALAVLARREPAE